MRKKQVEGQGLMGRGHIPTSSLRARLPGAGLARDQLAIGVAGKRCPPHPPCSPQPRKAAQVLPLTPSLPAPPSGDRKAAQFQASVLSLGAGHL